mmetsp:Transcript_137794/g.274774  ORF Transcript_137794/g.274774 Transcript_137794/m.274774 type:complete len:109 (-) Transcript_137794:240-566(-)|eukprot:CAMPEP_0172659176 /NCGR_PEP_ID=MMETSP1074-20121228/3260_1 /TAXON_ID=2916 /ORGANISM="Ceratium fusus, Strain PA161109" /LENGTH=108 /DNA_ID=CAMNT_0013474611 /DNA_START=101 /DNA_END=427 /DNA_ORIENTATION=-
MSFAEPTSKTVVRHVAYGIHLDKWDACEAFLRPHASKMRSFDGCKNVEFQVCGGTGRLGVIYHYKDLDSFKAYMDSDYYKALKEELLAADFYDSSKAPAEFIGYVQNI